MFKILESVEDNQYDIMNEGITFGTIIETESKDIKQVADYYNNLVKEVERLADILAEKRSDISHELYSLLQGNKLDESHIEHRMSVFKLPIDLMHCDGTNVTVQYDTLTTELQYVQVGEETLSEPVGAEEYYD